MTITKFHVGLWVVTVLRDWYLFAVMRNITIIDVCHFLCWLTGTKVGSRTSRTFLLYFGSLDWIYVV